MILLPLLLRGQVQGQEAPPPLGSIAQGHGQSSQTGHFAKNFVSL